MPEKYKRNSNTTCSACNKPMYRRPVEISTGRVFCSMVCYGISNRKEHPCVVCGKLIMSSLNKKTCSRSCSNTYRSGIQYKIGRPNDKAVLERSMKFKLFEERGKICERCGYAKYEILQVHHKNRNHADNKIENLELICPNCHCEEHYLKNTAS